MPRRKKRSAWASIAQVDARTWRIRFWAEGPDGYRRRSKTVRGTRKDAETARAQLMLEHGEDAPCPTVGEAWERWALPTFQQRREDDTLAASTVAQYMSTWSHDVQPTWGDVPLDHVRPLGIQQWISGLKLSTARTALVVLSAVMDYAVRYELIEHNPTKEKYLMPSPATTTRQTTEIWTLDELRDVWRGVRGEWYEPAFLLAAFGGCRVGESMGALASDVELRDVEGVPIALVRIERQVTQRGGVSGRLKNPQSRRTVAVAGRAALRLHELAQACGEPSWFLTHDGVGGHSRQDVLNRSWKALGDGRPFRNLRNSWQTWMRWTAKVPPHYIEPMMGHVLPGVTGAHYDRPTSDMFAEVMSTAYLARPWDASWDDLGR